MSATDTAGDDCKTGEQGSQSHLSLLRTHYIEALDTGIQLHTRFPAAPCQDILCKLQLVCMAAQMGKSLALSPERIRNFSRLMHRQYCPTVSLERIHADRYGGMFPVRDHNPFVPASQ